MADEQVTTETTSTETPTTETSTTATTTETEGLDLGQEGEKPTEKPEEKPDERTDEEKAADAAKAELFGAPAEGEAYEITGLPEGVEIDTVALEALTPVARELGLSSAGASKLAQVYAEQLPRVIEDYTSNMTQQILDTRKGWEQEAVAAIQGKAELKTVTGDKIEFDGKSVKQVQADAARAIDRLAPDGFREFLNDTGLGQHPAMVAILYQAGKSLAEDTSFEPGKGDGGTTSTGNKARSGGLDAGKFYSR